MTTKVEPKERKQMSKRRLLSIIGQAEKAALGSNVAQGPTVGGQTLPQGSTMTTLEVDRYNALNAYAGRPLGNEVQGRSQVVLTELRDTVEWIMPQLMRLFASTDMICRFEAENQTDETQAEIESKVINYLFMKRNDGFFVLYDYFKDALLLRNGYASVYYENCDRSYVENYTGLDEIGLALLFDGDDDIEVLEQSEEQKIIKVDDPALPPNTHTTQPVFDVKIRRTKTSGRIKVEARPNEEVLVSADARRSLDACSFVEIKREMRRSDLIEEGFDEAQIASITNYTPGFEDLVALARDTVVDQLSVDDSEDPSMQLILVRHVELRVDWDGDGIAELRRVILGGDEILENEEISEISLVSCSPMRMPHRHVGISLFDTLYDLQVIKSTLMRQLLDNIYLANNQRMAVNENNVTLEDMLVSRPGGIVRVNGEPGANIAPLESGGSLVQQIVPTMQYVDQLREMRTGVGKDTMGLDADALQDVTKGGQLAAYSAARMKIELIARLLAEGVKDIFIKMHSNLRRHADKTLTVQLAGQWVEVNPSQWGERSNVSVNVGLGTGHRDEARANMMLLAEMQEKLLPMGLVGPQQAYNSFKYGCQILGFENPQTFAMDPQSPEYQAYMQQHPQQPPPNVQVAHIKAQADQMKAQSQAQTEQGRMHSELIQAQEAELTARTKAAAEMQHAQNKLESSEVTAQDNITGQLEKTLLQIIGNIVAQQLKQNAEVNAGQVVAQDYDTLSRGIE